MPGQLPDCGGVSRAPVVAEDMLICPLAFWGVHSVIERRVHNPNKVQLGGDAKLIPEPIRPADRVLCPTARTVIGATNKANPPGDPNATEKMIDRIKKVVPEYRVVHSWGEWKSAVAEANPSLLTLIAYIRSWTNSEHRSWTSASPPI
ncbi:MAG: hypothetical protein MZV65_21275 [Chromatiales bacterium]|nr:hypothetical protein [Chromatiales bacterium]